MKHSQEKLEYRAKFRKSTEYYDSLYGEFGWEVTKDPFTDIYAVREKKIDPYEGRMIAYVNPTDGFAWREVTFPQAYLCILYNLFEVYIQLENNTESLVQDLGDLEALNENGFEFYIEAGFIDPDFNKEDL